MRRKYQPVSFDIKLENVSSLPVHHVNMLHVQSSMDEFFLTFSLVIPPEPYELDESIERGYLVGQAVVRLAVNRETMDNMICILKGEFGIQTQAIHDLEEYRNSRPPLEVSEVKNA